MLHLHLGVSGRSFKLATKAPSFPYVAGRSLTAPSRPVVHYLVWLPAVAARPFAPGLGAAPRAPVVLL